MEAAIKELAETLKKLEYEQFVRTSGNKEGTAKQKAEAKVHYERIRTMKDCLEVLKKHS